MSSGAFKTKDNMAAFAKIIESLGGTMVMVGVPGDASERIDDNGKVEPINNAALGYLMENGSPANNIPARPFLVPGVAGVTEETTRVLKQAGAKALNGDAGAADRGFHAVGLIAQSAVKRKMTEGPFQKLADSTLENRKRRGVTRENPLIDTTNLQNHMTYVLRKRKAKR